MHRAALPHVSRSGAILRQRREEAGFTAAQIAAESKGWSEADVIQLERSAAIAPADYISYAAALVRLRERSK